MSRKNVNAIQIPLTEDKLPPVYTTQINSFSGSFCGANSFCNALKLNMSVQRVAMYIDIVKQNMRENLTLEEARDRLIRKQPQKTKMAISGKQIILLIL